MRELPFKGKLILAPMAGYTDASFRKQCAQYGANLAVTELTSVEGIVRKAPENKLSDMLDVDEKEKPSIQLFGSNPEVMAEAAKAVEHLACVIDINFGCPAPHINAQDAGAALLLKPEQIRDIVSSVVEAVNIPVTAKIRIGSDTHHLTYKEVALAIEAAGASLITVHPRTTKQGYSGKADWTKIKEVVELVKIPVCGNGDVTSPEEAERMMKETGCDYVMIGRAALGNPFIFQQCNDYFEKGSYKEISLQEKIIAWKNYFDKAKGKVKNTRLKDQAMVYSKGFTGAKELRRKIASAKGEELRDVFDEYVN